MENPITYWADWLEERAAILQYDAGMSRDAAEREARVMMRHAQEEAARLNPLQVAA